MSFPKNIAVVKKQCWKDTLLLKNLVTGAPVAAHWITRQDKVGLNY